MTDKNPYRTLHARMSPPGAAWDEGFASRQPEIDRLEAERDDARLETWRIVHKCPSCDRYFDSPSICSDGTYTVEQLERVPDGTWPDQSAMHGVLLDQIKDAYAEGIADTIDRIRVRAAEMLPEVARFTLDEIEALAAADREKPETDT